MAKKKAPTPRPKYEGSIARANSKRLKKKAPITKGGNSGPKYDTRYMEDVNFLGKKIKRPYRPSVNPKPGLPKRRTAKLSK